MNLNLELEQQERGSTDELGKQITDDFLACYIDDKSIEEIFD